MTTRAEPFLTPGAWLAGFIKKGLLYIATYKIRKLWALWFRRFFFCCCLSHDAPGAWPVWTQRAWLAGFFKKTTIHCYTQNMKALCLVVSVKKIFLCLFFPTTPPGPGQRDTVGSIYKEEYTTMIHTKY